MKKLLMSTLAINTMLRATNLEHKDLPEYVTVSEPIDVDKRDMYKPKVDFLPAISPSIEPIDRGLNPSMIIIDDPVIRGGIDLGSIRRGCSSVLVVGGERVRQDAEAVTEALREAIKFNITDVLTPPRGLYEVSTIDSADALEFKRRQQEPLVPYGFRNEPKRLTKEERRRRTKHKKQAKRARHGKK